MSKIFIIDDDPDIVRLLKLAFESRQHTVGFAHNGTDGINMVENEKPDLIVLDIMMEKKDEGIHVARTLKSKQDIQHIPILMLTGIKDELGFDFKKEAGDDSWLPVEAYIDKSEDIDIIMSSAEKLITGKNP